jgi:hypothetical protein
MILASSDEIAALEAIFPRVGAPCEGVKKGAEMMETEFEWFLPDEEAAEREAQRKARDAKIAAEIAARPENIARLERIKAFLDGSEQARKEGGQEGAWRYWNSKE